MADIVLVALARFANWRGPSEITHLRYSGFNREKNRITGSHDRQPIEAHSQAATGESVAHNPAHSMLERSCHSQPRGSKTSKKPIYLPTRALLHKHKSTPGRNRTYNLRIRSPLLYPLSYGRVHGGRGGVRVYCCFAVVVGILRAVWTSVVSSFGLCGGRMAGNPA